MGKITVITAVLLFSSFAYSAKETFNDYSCWVLAASDYELDPLVLYSIAHIESDFFVKAINYRGEDDQDIGLMQINSFWFDYLDSNGISKTDLIDNPCLNVEVGAYVLSKSIEVFGATWRAVGAYNAGTSKKEKIEKKRERYASRVRFVYESYLNGLLTVGGG